VRGVCIRDTILSLAPSHTTIQPVEKLPAELQEKQMSLTVLRESENGKETKMGKKEE